MDKKSEIELIEELSFNAHPSLNTLYYDGWILRFAEGYTNRANSVNVLQDSTLPLEQKIRYCDIVYQHQKLPTVFKITPCCTEIDSLLDPEVYEVVTKTNMMTMDLSSIHKTSCLSEVVDDITPDWEENYFRLVCISDKNRQIAVKMNRNIVNKKISAMITDDGQVVACGLCVIERGYAGLYNIIVSDQYRRKGYGYDICVSLLSRAAELGAQKGYLQVVDANEKAKRLYSKIGYKDYYQYWYRVKKEDDYE